MRDDSFTYFICLIGSMFISAVKKTGGFFKRTVFRSVKKVFIMIYGVLKSVAMYIVRKIKAGIKDISRLFSEMKSVKKRRKAGENISYSDCFSALKRKHGALLRYVGNCAVVAVVIIAMLTALLNADMLCFALKVTVNGETAGYITDESVYLSAKARADERMSYAGEKAGDGEYKVAVVPVTYLNNESVIYTALLKASESKASDGCGVFIDGNFVCVTASQNEAKGVFDRILNDKNSKNPGYTYSFNEDIVFEYGLYPDSDGIKMTADELYSYLTTPVTDDKTYTCSKDDTYENAAAKSGITLEKLMKLNPSADEEKDPSEGEVLVVKRGDCPVTYTAKRVNVYTVSVPYETVNINSTSLYNGSSLVLKDGSQGVDQVTEMISYDEDGEETGKQEISRFTVKEAVAKRVAIGTKIPSVLKYTKSFGGVFLWPAPQNCFRLSSGYGYRSGRLHAGIDIISSDGGSCRGRPIVAAAAGYVVVAQYHYSWGNYVKIDHGNGIMTLYAHALDNSFKVSVGDYVVAGQQLSSIGTTGNSTGYHLHFEVWINGTRVDPLPYVYSESVQVVK